MLGTQPWVAGRVRPLPPRPALAVKVKEKNPPLSPTSCLLGALCDHRWSGLGPHRSLRPAPVESFLQSRRVWSKSETSGIEQMLPYSAKIPLLGRPGSRGYSAPGGCRLRVFTAAAHQGDRFLGLGFRSLFPRDSLSNGSLSSHSDLFLEENRRRLRFPQLRLKARKLRVSSRMPESLTQQRS